MEVNNRNITDMINEDKNYIDNFILDTSKGTKVMKNKFHEKAVMEKNSFIDRKIKEYTSYQDDLLIEINKRLKKIYPIDDNVSFDELNVRILNLKKIFKLKNKYADVNYRLGLTKLIYDLKDFDKTNLEIINQKIIEIINILGNAGITLYDSNFTYSPYTYSYMSLLMKEKNKNDFNEIMKSKFEEIYWECPLIINHIRLNFNYIVSNNQKQLNLFLSKKIKENLNKSNIMEDKLFLKCNELSHKLVIESSTDSFNLVNRFLSKELLISDYLDGSATRKKSFDSIAKNNSFDTLNDVEKDNFYIQSNELYNTLNELEDYYYFKPIIESLKNMYTSKNEIGKAYINKIKEININEKKREKLFKDYIKSINKTLFSKNTNQTKLLLNEQIDKLNILYQELDDMEISNNVTKYINNTSTIYDLLLVGFSSYKYLKKIYNEVYSLDEYNISMDNLLKKLFNYLFNSTNSFIYKTLITTNEDVITNICSRFNLLGLNISKEELDKDELANLKNRVAMIVNIYYVLRSDLTMSDIEFIYNAKNI